MEGVCKPDPRIFQLCLQRLNLQPSQAIFLDDLGPNVKVAASLGIRTIKVILTVSRTALPVNTSVSTLSFLGCAHSFPW